MKEFASICDLGQFVANLIFGEKQHMTKRKSVSNGKKPHQLRSDVPRSQNVPHRKEKRSGIRSVL